MKKRHLYKECFAVIGKSAQGPAVNPQGWVPALWRDSNQYFDQINPIVKKDESGRPLIWGAMNDAAEQNQRWGDTGKYLAGAETDIDAEAPEGWTRWIIPSQTYLVVGCTLDTYGEIFSAICADSSIHITGTVHEQYPDAENPNQLELYFPIAEGKLYCQSCAMPMTEPEHFGTEANGQPSLDYCCHCYENGAFRSEVTMLEMIENCLEFAVQAGEYDTAEQARAAMNQFFPTLKRWATL